MSGAQTGIKNPTSGYCILINLDLLNLVGKYFIAGCILEGEQFLIQYSRSAQTDLKFTFQATNSPL